MYYQIVKMSFPHGLRIGSDELGIGAEKANYKAHSDTIFSAICHAWLDVYGEESLTKLLENFDANLPFEITSSNLFVGNTYYLPKPLSDAAGIDKSDAKASKELKKSEILKTADWIKWINGDMVSASEIKTGNDEAKKHYFIELDSKVNIGADPFYVGFTYFKDEAGLYFLIKYNEPEMKDKLESVIGIMQENGLGGKRSAGKGKLRIELADIKDTDFEKILNNDKKNYFINLSIFNPAEETKNNLISENNNRYTVIKKSGHVQSPYNVGIKKKTVNMIAEGGCFVALPIGRIVDVTPINFNQHKVYRYGHPFCVPAGGNINAK